MHKWYVLQVTSGKEEQVAKRLNSRGFSTIVPIENRIIRNGGKWVQRQYIVFDGYVFVCMNYSWSKYYAMSGINGIIKILGGGKEPVALTNAEIEFVKYLSGALITPSVIRFKDDNTYEIVSGFLLDYKDKIVKLQRRYKKAAIKVIIANEEKTFRVSFVEFEEQMPVPTAD